MSEQHAPLPWSVGKIEHGGIYPIWAKIGPLNVQPATAHGLPEAELIVQSVNALPALVRALEAAESWIRKDIDDVGIDMLSEEYKTLWDTVRAALSSVRGSR